MNYDGDEMGNRRQLINRIEILKQSADEKTAAVFDEVLSELKQHKYGLVYDDEGKIENTVMECERRVPTLLMDRSRTVENDGEKNILIEGDNYHSLKVLNRFNKEDTNVEKDIREIRKNSEEILEQLTLLNALIFLDSQYSHIDSIISIEQIQEHYTAIMQQLLFKNVFKEDMENKK